MSTLHIREKFVPLISLGLLFNLIFMSNAQAATSPYHDASFAGQWESEFYLDEPDEWFDTTVDIRHNSAGLLIMQVHFLGTEAICDVELQEQKSEMEDYLITLTATRVSRCGGSIPRKAMLIPYYWSKAWPSLRLYSSAGVRIAGGFLVNDSLRPKNIDERLHSDLVQRRANAETEIELAAIESRGIESIGVACQARELRRQVASNRMWCQCLGEHFLETLSADKYSAAVADYNTFHKKLNQDPSETGDWSYNEVINQCQSCGQNNYAGCLPSDDKTPNKRTYSKLLSDLKDDSPIVKDLLYAQFYLDYLKIYSDQCGEHMSSGVERTNTNQSVNSYGDAVGPAITSVIKIESANIVPYDRHKRALNNERMKNLIKPLDRAETKNFLAKSLQKSIDRTKYLFERIIVLREHMAAGCTSGDVKTVYRRLYDLEH